MVGRLFHIVNLNIQVGGRAWSGGDVCLLPCAALFLYFSLSAFQLSTCQGCYLPLPLNYLSTCKSGLDICSALGSVGMRESCCFEIGLCSSCAVFGLNYTVDLSSGSPMCQVFCFAVAWLTLENVPAFRGVAVRDSWQPCTSVIKETTH